MIEIKKEIVSRLRKYDDYTDFKELVSVELINGTILNNVILRNINVKNINEQLHLEEIIKQFEKDDPFFSLADNKIYKENRIGIENIKRIYESQFKIPSKLHDLLGRSPGNYTEKGGMFHSPYYIFCVKLKNNKNFNFKIQNFGNYDNFLDFPENYTFKDFGKIQKHKVFFNNKMYSYFDDKIQKNISVIKFYEIGMSFDCYIDKSVHFWRNKTSHNTS
jgi:hypothetical protein